MILFTTTFCLEFATEDGRPGHFRVSSWAEGDIERAFPGVDVEEVDADIYERRWRRFKAIVRREAVFALLQSEAKKIDYDMMFPHILHAENKSRLQAWWDEWIEDSLMKWLRKTKA